MTLTITEVIAELDRAGLPHTKPKRDRVLTLCVICPGEMTWKAGAQRWTCDRADCPSQDYPSAIGNELHFRANRYAA